jgi:hypothetical protein
MPKYVAPNLREPKQVWVPSKSGWMCVGTMALETWFNGIIIAHHMIESSIEAYCIFYPNAKSKQVKSKVLQHTNAIFQVVVIYWIYLVVCKYLSWCLLVDGHKL